MTSKRGGHAYYVGQGVRLTTPGGVRRNEPWKDNDALAFLRALEGAGFRREDVRAAIEGRPAKRDGNKT